MTESRSAHPEFCQYTFSDNRQCRMLRQTNHPTLCPFHARDEQQLLESHTLGAQIATSYTGDFLTAGRHQPRPEQSLHRPGPNPHTSAYRRHNGLPGPNHAADPTAGQKKHPFVYSHETWNT